MVLVVRAPAEPPSPSPSAAASQNNPAVLVLSRHNVRNFHNNTRKGELQPFPSHAQFPFSRTVARAGIAPAVQAVRTDKGRPLSCSSSTGRLLLRPHLQKKIQEFVQTPSHTNTLTRRNQNNVSSN